MAPEIKISSSSSIWHRNRFLDTECSLNREEIIYEYNRLIEDIWHLEHTVSELQKDYDLMTEAYEDVSNELYG